MAKCSRCGKGGIFRKLNESGICKECEHQWNIDSLKVEIDSLTLVKSAKLAEIDDLKSALSDRKTEYDKLYKEASKQAKTDILEKTKNEVEAMRKRARSELEETYLNASKKKEEIVVLKYKIETLASEAETKKNEIVQLDDTILYQEFGLYEPQYGFCSVDSYKASLKLVRDYEKACIKEMNDLGSTASWTVNDSAAQGRKMVKDILKLLVKAFNHECDSLIDKVKYHNHSAYIERMKKSCENISKLGAVLNIEIPEKYLGFKLMELDMAYEYQCFKQKEKEHQQELREQAREEKKLQKEIEESRKKLIKEKLHYSSELDRLKERLLSAEDDKKNDISEKIEKIENSLLDIDKSIHDVDYREANQRAGYVYIISNIGSFGEGIFKIGMTRRLDPYERVYELSDASVPFNFDVHAMIFSDDAPSLETALHRAFEPFKVNLVNQRREFFKVSLDQIKDEVRKNHDKIVEFFELPEAEQYRLSQKMRTEGRVAQ